MFVRNLRGAISGRCAVALVLVVASCRSAGGHGGEAPATERGDTLRSAATAPSTQRAASDSEWAGRPVTRIEELFEGRFPGVRVFYTPGQGIAVRVRGSTSVMGSNEPLYVLDGFPIEPGPGGLIAINPSDIATIEVLKDAGSTSAYGVRGANGVVLITTKRDR